MAHCTIDSALTSQQPADGLQRFFIPFHVGRVGLEVLQIRLHLVLDSDNAVKSLLEIVKHSYAVACHNSSPDTGRILYGQGAYRCPKMLALMELNTALLAPPPITRTSENL